jgi:NitT/TauT family transport system substrate-binding protein
MAIRFSIAVALAAALLAGCGDDSERTKVTVALVPIHEVAPVHLGVEKGFFEAEGLDVEVQTVQGGAEIVPQVMSGDVQIGFSSTSSLLSAAATGLPLEIVAPARGAGDDAEGAVMVPRDSPIRGYRDLAGRTVAVNALENVVDLTLSAALERRGVDRDDVERLEVPFPDMQAALDAGSVDAAFMAAPFTTIAERSGRYRSIGFPMYDVRPGFVFTGYFASKAWADENEDVLDRFLSALRRSMAYAAEHERETREAIGRFTELPDGLINAIPIGNPRPDCAELAKSTALLADLMVDYGALDRAPAVGRLIRPGFCDATAVRVGVLPIAAVAPVYAAIEHGYFADAGLEVTPEVGQGGAALVPAVISGDHQFAYTNNVSLIQAQAQGLPLRVVADAAQALPSAPGAEDALVVREPADLEGATIGVNTVGNLGDVVIRAALEADSVDPATLEFVEIPFPDMVAAVEAGRVDAGWVVEPFIQAADAAGLRTVLSPFAATAERLGGEGLSIASYITSEDFAQANPDVVDAFARALERAFRRLEGDPDELRRIVRTYTDIPAPVAARMALPAFTADLTGESIPFLEDLMAEYGLIER